MNTRFNRRVANRREARIREAEKAIRWTLDHIRMDLPTIEIRHGAKEIVDGRRTTRHAEEKR